MKTEERKLIAEAKKLASEKHHSKAGDIYLRLRMYFEAACEYAQPDWSERIGYLGAALKNARDILREHPLSDAQKRKLAKIAAENKEYGLSAELYENLKDIRELERLTKTVEKDYGMETQAGVIRKTLKRLREELGMAK